jgi:hypothetical protein
MHLRIRAGLEEKQSCIIMRWLISEKNSVARINISALFEKCAQDNRNSGL